MFTACENLNPCEGSEMIAQDTDVPFSRTSRLRTAAVPTSPGNPSTVPWP